MIFHPYQTSVTIHNKDNITIPVTNDASLQGWKDTKGFLHIPLIHKVMDLTMHTTASGQTSSGGKI
jgi:hypothetical protein